MLVHILNGPNLNTLGSRQPHIYGSQSIQQLEQSLITVAKSIGASIVFKQTNCEGELVSHLQQANNENADAVVINPAAYAHTSVALLDAALASNAPVIEVHISQIHQRETFRRTSLLSQAACAVLCGFGVHGYTLALQAVPHVIQQHKKSKP